MNIVCFLCGSGMGETNVEPTDEIKVWYGVHPGCEFFLSIPERFQLDEHVKKQNKLPEIQGKGNGAHIHPAL